MDSKANDYGSSVLTPEYIAAQKSINSVYSAMTKFNYFKGIQDINASTETVYPRINGNSMNKKLEAAKKYLKERVNGH